MHSCIDFHSGACGRAGQAQKALELFQNMKDDGLAADRVAYNALFSALRVSKDADRVSSSKRKNNTNHIEFSSHCLRLFRRLITGLRIMGRNLWQTVLLF